MPSIPALDDHASAHADLHANLPVRAWRRTGIIDVAHPSPVMMTIDEVEHLTTIGALLARTLPAVCAAVINGTLPGYADPTDEVLAQLRRLDGVPYQLGFVRPDYLYDTDGIPRLCEVNARFAVNGSIATLQLMEAFAALGHEPVPGLRRLAEHLDTLGDDADVLVAKGREEGWDLHPWMAEHERVRVCAPERLREQLASRPSTLLLELHQDELAAVLPHVIDFQLAGGRVVNDPRTVMVAHDKRLLAALCDPAIIRRWLPDDDADRLADAIVPSLVVRHHPHRVTASNERRSGWVAKVAISGKGDGLHLGCSTSARAWRTLTRRRDVVFQPRLDQPEHEVETRPDEEVTRERWVLAGTLPIHDDACFGPGLVRCYTQSPHRFRAVAQPVLTDPSP